MEHKDHIHLIETGIPKGKSVWADFGSGEGSFTLALADLVHPQSEIYSIDLDNHRLQIQKKLFQQMFPTREVYYYNTDFTKQLVLPPLDGIIMANSLHYIQDKKIFLMRVKRYLKKTGRIIFVEYNTERHNYWVPYPISYRNLYELLNSLGFYATTLLSTIPSQFLKEIYAAVTYL